MPWPQKISIGNGQFIINSDFTITINKNTSRRVKVATTKFLRRLSGRTGIFMEKGFAFNASEIKNPSIDITFNRIGKLEIYEDESYELKVSDTKIYIHANTDLGVIHALETLLQLMTTSQDNYYFPKVTINDKPRFTWRGLMIDVARHFQPVDVLKRNLDAMAAVKLNVFHWHLTDDQGFRIESKSYPKLHELGSDGLYYTQSQIKEVVEYASDRGILVVPEIDVPGHATAILTAYPEIASKDTIYSIERFSGIFNPTLDPTNNKTYEILDSLFGELASLFPGKYIHIGGDENEGEQWDENVNIQEFKKKHNLITNHDLQTYFNLKLEKILGKYGKSIMGWEEIMTNNMPTTALIHSWKGINENVTAGESLIKAAKKGYNTILSNGYYIDLMQPVSKHYLVNPIPNNNNNNNNNLTFKEKQRILGGEATMWSELVTSLNIDSRLWPRTIAIAERFWSDEKITDLESMYKRLKYVSFRLEELGITHLRNKNVILRNITNNQQTESLEVLTKICEPVKIYTRNAGGVEYKTYSPFTLFADACTVDASDSFKFNKSINLFLNNQNSKNTEELIHFFDKWITNYTKFKDSNRNPILTTILPLYKNIASVSKIYKKVLLRKKATQKQLKEINKLLLELKKPVVDVELATYEDLNKLFSFFNKKKLILKYSLF